MASNDGQRLTIFGLSYRQHDNRSMQRILREYNQLPANPGDRAGLFVALTSLARELDEEKSEAIKNWLQNGGEFPSRNLVNPEHEFGRGPPATDQSPDMNQPPFLGSRSGPAYPRYPTAPGRGRGRGFGFGRGPAPFMGAPGFPNMTMPGAFMGNGYPGYNPRPSSVSFMGVGRPLVDNNALAPEFPTANALSNNATNANEDTLMGGYSGQRLSMSSRRPLANDMNEMTLAEFQRQQRQSIGMNPIDHSLDQMGTAETTMDENDTTRGATFEDDWDSDDEEGSDEEDELTQHLARARIRRVPPGSVPLGVLEDPAGHDPIHDAPRAPLVVPDEPIPEGYLECCVCAESLDPTRFPASPRITSTCHHLDDSLVCLDCIEQAIRAPVDEGVLNLVTCPLCPEKLSVGEIKMYASERIFARYQYLLMSLNPDMVFCLAPNCGSGQVHPPQELGPMMNCEKCSFKTCVHHKLPWHEGQTCDEFDCDESQIERLEQEEATAKLLAALASKICPTCKQGVDRTDGCDHLRCRCGGEWCFDCLASWENILRLGMEAHAPTCKNHPRRVQMRADQKSSNEAKILESVHGGKVSDALQKARQERNVRNRERIRPLALEAAEKRAKEEAVARRAQEEEQGTVRKQKKAKLLPAWEEK